MKTNPTPAGRYDAAPSPKEPAMPFQPTTATDSQILALTGDTPAFATRHRDLVEHVEHPLAKVLYRQFKPGSGRMEKSTAYDIGNELDRQATRILQLEKMLGLSAGKEG